MKERLDRYNRTRTDMLNAVSHDLKAPLTRMRLAVETDTASNDDLIRDIDRMTEMINGYLAFARGEAPEIEQATELPPMLIRIARDAAPDKKIETNFPDTPKQFYARPLAMSRTPHRLTQSFYGFYKSGRWHYLEFTFNTSIVVNLFADLIY